MRRRSLRNFRVCSCVSWAKPSGDSGYALIPVPCELYTFNSFKLKLLE